MDKMKKTIEKQEDQIGQELVHFGPEDNDRRVITMLENKKNKQKFIEAELTNQINNKKQQLGEFKKEQTLVDAQTMNTIGEQLSKEKEASKAKTNNQQALYRAEWELQKIEAQNRKKVDDIITGGVY